MARMAALALLALPCGNAVASEPQQTLVGELAVLHTDGEPGGGSTDSYALATAGGEVEVRFTGAHPTYALEGSVVQLDGTRAPDGSLHVDLGAEPGALSVLASGGNGGGQLALTDTRNVLVMLVNFTDNRAQPYTAGQAAAGMFGATGSVDALYRDSSYGLLDLEGEVRGWYELNVSSAGCNTYSWMDLAMAAAVAQGVNLASFQHYVLAFPSAGACGWAGLGTLGGSYTWINGNTFDVAVAGHELGHNLGFHHASSYACTSGGARVVLSSPSTCTGPNGAGEYGDPFDVMGGAWNLRQFSAFHKNAAGWLGASQTITATGAYALTSSSFTSSGARALRIARPNGEELWLELRSPSGEFDDFGAGDPAVTGVTARVTKPGYLVQTKLLDCNPEQAPLSQSFGNAALQPGQSFTDPVSGVSVRTDSVGPLGASVTVTFPAGGGADTTAPPAPSLTGGPDGTGSVDLAWYPIGDASGIARYEVLQGSSTVQTTIATSWRTVAPAPGGSATYTVRAVDGAGNIGPQSMPLTVLTALPPTPPPPPVDTDTAVAPPGRPQALVVALARKRVGKARAARVRVVARLDWRAPAGGAAAYDVRRGGKRIAVVPKARYLDTSVASLRTRSVTYTVIAIGPTGLRSPGASITVRLAAAR